MLKNMLLVISVAVLLGGTATHSPSAQANGWVLQSCDYEAGTGWVGTYRSAYGSGRYIRTIVFDSYCPYTL